MTEKPNVLLICADHWAGEMFGVAGHPVVLTPGLDEIAQAGVRFTRAYSEFPVCIPARRTLMTGLSPRGHGDRVFKDDLRCPEIATLAQAFRDAGYQADAVGKLHVQPSGTASDSTMSCSMTRAARNGAWWTTTTSTWATQVFLAVNTTTA